MKGILREGINYTRWERFVHKIIHFFFKEEIEDLIADAMGAGFSNGYGSGYSDCKKNTQNGHIDLYENGKEAGRREYFLSLKSFDPENVVRISAGKIYIGSDELKENEAKILKEEAKLLKSTKIWSFFVDTITETARQTMFEKSETFDDMKTGKLMLFNLDLLEKMRNKFEKYEFPSKENTKPLDYGKIGEDHSSVNLQ